MTDETPTPVDPARVHAALQVLGWPDDRVEPAGDPEGYTNALTGVHWEAAEDAIRAADAASSEQHLIEFMPDGWIALRHPLSCRPSLAACPVNKLVMALHDPLPPGQYECAVNDLGDRLLIGDRIDVPEATDA